MVQAKRLRDAQDWNTRDDRDIMGFTRASFSDHLKGTPKTCMPADLKRMGVK